MSAEKGESFSERHLAFESWEGFNRTLTGKRLELLRHVHRHPPASMSSQKQAAFEPRRSGA
jgi:predicted transcriptional regulator